ncbi:hypothetical protein FCR2A7T_24910 [Flavobacterium cauense R2A-7]|uniref:Uncharacterized protein n=2 Tax=Flavobacteriaceae TaxID=49546 RepID=V6RX72_9FLAO|nr:hypothetical protein FCR2A7T_24910 [Flavobacterium cauense R2A-7]TWI15260.1 hypothetical protein IP98_00251 [Flavobacterium cauense R2A-7]
MNYKTALCKTAWGKKLLAQVAKHTCFCTKNCDSNFFKALENNSIELL